MAILTFLRRQLSPTTFSDVVKTEIVLYPSVTNCQQESGRTCEYFSQIRCTSLQSVDCCCMSTSGLQLSFSFCRIIVLFLLMSVCLRPCSCGLNCTNYNISCHRGMCIEAKSALHKVNRTGAVICACEDRWSGPACDVFSCSGRALWVLPYSYHYCWFQGFNCQGRESGGREEVQPLPLVIVNLLCPLFCLSSILHLAWVG